MYASGWVGCNREWWGLWQTGELPSCLKASMFLKLRRFLVAQQVKDPALTLLWLGLQLWHGCDPWPGNFCMPQEWPKKENWKTLCQPNKNMSIETQHCPSLRVRPLTHSCPSPNIHSSPLLTDLPPTTIHPISQILAAPAKSCNQSSYLISKNNKRYLGLRVFAYIWTKHHLKHFLKLCNPC